MQRKTERKLMTILLSLSMLLSQAGAVFAVTSDAQGVDDALLKDALSRASDSETAKTEEKAGAVEQLPGKEPLMAEEPGDGQDPSGDSGTDEPEPTDPDDPPEPPEVHKLEGKVYEHAYTASIAEAKISSGKKITITLGDGSKKEVTSGSDGSISLDLAESELSASGEYSWSFDKDENYLDSAGALKEGEDNKLYIKERYEPSSADYTFADSDDIISRILRKAGVYTILPASDRKLARTQDGEAKDSLTITVDENGKLEDFYIYTGNNCSKALSSETAEIDDGAPEIGEITTSAASENTYVKEHGIYSKEKAKILVNAKIREEGVGLDRVYLVGKKDDETTTYEPVSSSHGSGEYTYTIALPDKETILDAEVMYLVAEDKFGNRSKETLIAKTEDGSSVTLEAIAPTLEISVSGNPNSNGWYNYLPTVTAKAKDDLSGLAGMSLLEDGEELDSKSFDEKENESQSVKGKVKIDEPSSSGKYHIEATATDNSGNVNTKKKTLRIDLVDPVLSASGVTSGEHYRTSPTVRVTEEEQYYSADGAYIRYRVVRDGKKEVANKTIGKVKEATIPSSTFKKDGVYTVTINACDAAGNASNELSYKFTKDSTAPVVSWSGVQNGKFYNSRQTAKLTVKERFYKTDSVRVSAVRKLGGSTSNIGFPWKNSGVTSESSKALGETGTYTLTASATDKAGNSSGKKTVTFTVDTKAPEISITGVSDGGLYTYGMGVAPSVKVTDDYPDSQSISYTKAGVPVSDPSFEQTKENDGLYTMTVSATDKAGNTTTKTISFTINRFGSYFEYNDAIKDAMGNAFQNIDKDLVITERNVSDVTESDLKVFRDGKSVANTAKTNEAENEDGYHVYRHVFSKDNFADEGAYEINVASEDSAGNTMESRDENGKVVFYVDRTAPTLTIEGIDPKGIKGETAELTVQASDLLTGVEEVSATVNGSPVALRESGDGAYTLTLREGSDRRSM